MKNRLWSAGILLLCGLFFQPLCAQDAPAEVDETEFQTEKTRPEWRPGIALGLGTGTQGIFSVDATYGVLPWLSLRAGYNHLDFTVEETEIDGESVGFSDQVLLLTVDSRMNTLSGLVDLSLPNPKMRWLRVSVGAHFALDQEVVANVVFRDNVQFNDLKLTPAEVGDVTLTYTPSSSVMPYVGLGFGPTLPWKRIAFTADLGGFYRGEPRFATEGTGFLAGNEQAGRVLTENAKEEFNWHPVVSVRLGVRLN